MSNEITFPQDDSTTVFITHVPLHTSDGCSLFELDEPIPLRIGPPTMPELNDLEVEDEQ